VGWRFQGSGVAAGGRGYPHLSGLSSSSVSGCGQCPTAMMKHIRPKAAELRGWWHLDAVARIRLPLAGWLVVVALETPPLLAIVAQNASVPSYGWGSFSSSRSCFHQHRGGWPSLSPSFLPSTVTAWAAPASNGVVTRSSRLLISALTFAQLKWLSGPDQNTTFVGVTNCCPQPPAGAFVFLVGGLGSELSSIALQWCA